MKNYQHIENIQRVVVATGMRYWRVFFVVVITLV